MKMKASYLLLLFAHSVYASDLVTNLVIVNDVSESIENSMQPNRINNLDLTMITELTSALFSQQLVLCPKSLLISLQNAIELWNFFAIKDELLIMQKYDPDYFAKMQQMNPEIISSNDPDAQAIDDVDAEMRDIHDSPYSPLPYYPFMMMIHNVKTLQATYVELNQLAQQKDDAEKNRSWRPYLQLLKRILLDY